MLVLLPESPVALGKSLSPSELISIFVKWTMISAPQGAEETKPCGLVVKIFTLSLTGCGSSGEYVDVLSLCPLIPKGGNRSGGQLRGSS